MKFHSLLSSILLAAVVVVGGSASSPALALPSAEGIAVTQSPIATLTANVTGITVYGSTPHGVRVDVAFEGMLFGRLHGGMEGVDYSTIRPDGVTEVDVRAKIVTADQALIAVEISGVLIDGKVSDTRVKFVTAAPQYAWLMDKIIVGKGTATTEKLAIKYFLIE